jgi:hypothetical protein
MVLAATAVAGAGAAVVVVVVVAAAVVVAEEAVPTPVVGNRGREVADAMVAVEVEEEEVVVVSRQLSPLPKSVWTVCGGQF